MARRSILFCPYCGTKRATRRKTCAACGGDLAALMAPVLAPTAPEIEPATSLPREPAMAPSSLSTERPLPVVPGITRREDVPAAEAARFEAVPPTPEPAPAPAPAQAPIPVPTPGRERTGRCRLCWVLGVLLLALIVADVVAVALAYNAGYLTFSPAQPTPQTIIVTPAPGTGD